MADQVPTEDPYDWVCDHRTGGHWVFLCMLTVPQKTGKAVQNSWLVVRRSDRKVETEEEAGGMRSQSDGQSEGADDAVHGLVLPSHSAAPVSRAVPEAGTRCV